jgi:hypothetical protein
MVIRNNFLCVQCSVVLASVFDSFSSSIFLSYTQAAILAVLLNDELALILHLEYASST